jgi:hypothetical protein
VYKTPAEGIFCDECGTVHKPAIVEDYSWHMDYINKGDRMAKS